MVQAVHGKKGNKSSSAMSAGPPWCSVYSLAESMMATDAGLKWDYISAQMLFDPGLYRMVAPYSANKIAQR